MQHSSKKQKAAVVTSVGGNALQSGVVTILEFLILIQHLEKYWYSIGHNGWSDHSQMSGMRWTYVGTGVSRVTSVRVIKCSRCRFIDSLEKKYWTHLKFSESIHIHTLILHYYKETHYCYHISFVCYAAIYWVTVPKFRNHTTVTNKAVLLLLV